MIYGWELIIDLKDCNDKIKDKEALREYLRLLLKKIDMKAYGEPLIKWFGEALEKTKGYSIFQFIETSSIVGHFTDEFHTAHINIFSCKGFDYKLAYDFTRDYFGGKGVQVEFIYRIMNHRDKVIEEKRYE